MDPKVSGVYTSHSLIPKNRRPSDTPPIWILVRPGRRLPKRSTSGRPRGEGPRTICRQEQSTQALVGV